MSKQEQRFLIGLDYGSESARGVLIDAATGEQIESLVEPYPHGIMSDALPLGARLPRAWALQDAADYVHAARVILSSRTPSLRHRRGTSVLRVAMPPHHHDG